eukprot:GFYU01008312.1.p1 GENE.GFYU01008312.1~~GFYU01008312.1.p1  ORF type:complete len:373 (-),score=90.12 GFYU01008312.1:197-1315(-)
MPASTTSALLTAGYCLAAVASGCPFAGQAQSDDSNENLNLRRLQSQLLGSPEMTNGAFFNVKGTTGVNASTGKSTFQTMSDLATTLGEDMCIWTLQSLPPPDAKNTSFQNVHPDDLKFTETGGQIATARLAAKIGADKNGGSVFFSGCMLGSEGTKAVCAAKLPSTGAKFSSVPDHYCQAASLNQDVKWAQAFTGFRVSATNVDQATKVVTDWRSQEAGHATQMTWAFAGGNPSAGGAQVAGWGADGGLRAKVVKCSSIPSQYMYHDAALAECDYVSDGATTTWANEAYRSWKDLCSYDLATGALHTSCAAAANPSPSPSTPSPSPSPSTPTPSTTTPGATVPNVTSNEGRVTPSVLASLVATAVAVVAMCV